MGGVTRQDSGRKQLTSQGEAGPVPAKYTLNLSLEGRSGQGSPQTLENPCFPSTSLVGMLSSEEPARVPLRGGDGATHSIYGFSAPHPPHSKAAGQLCPHPPQSRTEFN